jgi:hypothetical protein
MRKFATKGLLTIVVSALIDALLLRAVVLHRRRYNKFRNEVAWVFQSQSEQLGDLNRRLTQAGYPAGRLDTTTQTPEWYRNGQMPDGTPIPEQFRQ